MKKINKKGFMMAELVVVSSIVLVTLVSLYSSYNNIYSIYKNRIGYYDVATLYRLGYYRDILNKYDLMEDVKNRSLSEKIVTIYRDNAFNGVFLSLSEDINPNNVEDSVFMIYNNKNKIDSSIFNGIYNINVTFKDYVDYLNDSVKFDEFEYMLIMERCNLKDDENENIDSCNYAYLEIFPEEDNTLEEIKYIVKYDANGGIDKGVSEQEKIPGQPLRLKDEIPTREGYGFMGWSILQRDEFSPSFFVEDYWPDKNNNKYFLDFGVKYIDEDYLQYYTKDESVTLYAVWKKLYDKNYTLIFDVNMFAKNDYDGSLKYNVYDKECYFYNGEYEYGSFDDSFPKTVSVYINSVLVSKDVTDFFEEVNFGDKWSVSYNGKVLAQGVIGDGKNYLYYGGKSSVRGDNWYYFEYVVDLSNNGDCRR